MRNLIKPANFLFLFLLPFYAFNFSYSSPDIQYLKIIFLNISEISTMFVF